MPQARTVAKEPNQNTTQQDTSSILVLPHGEGLPTIPLYCGLLVLFAPNKASSQMARYVIPRDFARHHTVSDMAAMRIFIL